MRALVVLATVAVAAAAFALSGFGMPLGALTTAASAEYGAPSSPPTAATSEYPPPVNTAPPTISGSPIVGETLTADPGSWTSDTTPTYAYQWVRCGVELCAPIDGATAQTYTVQDADAVAREPLAVQVTARNANGSATAQSARTAVPDHRPSAAGDSYDATPGQQRSVAAPGVLANDSDADGDSLTAVLQSEPAHASSFHLNADGSFTYTADPSFVGTDSFTYRASDGRAQSTIATVTIGVAAAPSGAVSDLPGCDTNTLDRNDDDSTDGVRLPFPLNFFGQRFDTAYVNNNGNITFTEPLGDFTPDPIVANGTPIIAPFWADVDTTGEGSGVVHYGTTVFAGHTAFCVVWPHVGYYGSHTDRLNTFQLLLVDRADTNPSPLPAGSGDNFDIYFNYDNIGWETGDASGGRGGLGGHPARIGYSNGAAEAFELPGSAQSGYFLDTSATGLIHHSQSPSGGSQLGRYVFEIRTGESPTASITGTVRDGENDGVGIANARVRACRASSCTTTQTGADGSYAFGGLAAGTYTVRATPPSGRALVPRGRRVTVRTSETTTQDFTLTNPAPDLRLQVSGSQDVAAGGGTVTFTYTLTNEGNAAASGVSLSASIPSGTTLVRTSVQPTQASSSARRLAQASSCSPSGSDVVCDLGTVAAGGGDVVSMAVRPDSAGTYSTTGVADSAETASDPASGSVTAAPPTPTTTTPTTTPATTTTTTTTTSQSGGGGSGSGGGGGSPATTTTTTTTAQPPPPPPNQLPPPTAAVDSNVVPVLGTVLVNGQPLVIGQPVPLGATIDATNGIVQVTAIGADGTPQTSYFFGGVFVVVQDKPGDVPSVELRGGDFATCKTPPKGRRHISASDPKAPKATKHPKAKKHVRAKKHPKAKGPRSKKAKKSTKVVRSLWGEGKGVFRTQGRYAAATVRGTFWLTADRCDGTLVRVNEGTVSVRDTVRNRTIVLNAGQSYLSLAS